MFDDEEKPIVKPKSFRERFKLSEEEKMLFEKCNHEALWQRSMPMSTIFAGSIYYLIEEGFMKVKSGRIGAARILGAGFIGYVLGKVSYHNECMKKFIDLPDSRIGAMLRKRLKLPEPIPKIIINPETSNDHSNKNDSLTQSKKNTKTKPCLTYEELRQKNRLEYLKRRSQIIKNQKVSTPQEIIIEKNTNIHGDELD